MLISWFWSLYYDCVIILGFKKYKLNFLGQKSIKSATFTQFGKKKCVYIDLKENNNANLAKC